MKREDLKNIDVPGSDKLRTELRQAAAKLIAFDSEKTKDFTKTKTLMSLFAHLGDCPPIKLLEDALNYYKKSRHYLKTVVIPSLLNALGMSGADLENGIKVSIKKEVTAKPVENRTQELYTWISENGGENYLKHIIEIGVGQDPTEFIAAAEKSGYNISVRRAIHPQTLKKAIRLMIEDEDIRPPEDLCDIDYFDIASVREA